MLWDRPEPTTHTATVTENIGTPDELTYSYEVVARDLDNAVILVDQELEALNEDGADHDTGHNLVALGKALLAIYEVELFNPEHPDVVGLFDDQDEYSRDEAWQLVADPPLGLSDEVPFPTGTGADQ